jgi:inosine-uridine nucleoside N-ribohydrolase
MNPFVHAEHNTMLDPAAFRSLLASGVKLTMLPLDSTQARPSDALLASVLAKNAALATLTEQWIKHYPFGVATVTLYDVVATAALTAPDLCKLTPLRVVVDGAPNADACLSADGDAILSRMAADLMTA